LQWIKKEEKSNKGKILGTYSLKKTKKNEAGFGGNGLSREEGGRPW